MRGTHLFLCARGRGRAGQESLIVSRHLARLWKCAGDDGRKKRRSGRESERPMPWRRQGAVAALVMTDGRGGWRRCVFSPLIQPFPIRGAGADPIMKPSGIYRWLILRTARITLYNASRLCSCFRASRISRTLVYRRWWHMPTPHLPSLPNSPGKSQRPQ